MPLSAPPDTRRGQILYDGQCPLCLKSVGILKRLDWLSRLSYVNARDREQWPASDASLDPERLIQEMHVLTPDGHRLYHGFAALRLDRLAVAAAVAARAALVCSWRTATRSASLSMGRPQSLPPRAVSRRRLHATAATVIPYKVAPPP